MLGALETSARTSCRRGKEYSVRARVAAFNNPVQSFAMGLGCGYAGLPVPQGFGTAMKAGATVGKVLDNVVKAVQVIF